jgi:hypothetical protein
VFTATIENLKNSLQPAKKLSKLAKNEGEFAENGRISGWQQVFGQNCTHESCVVVRGRSPTKIGALIGLKPAGNPSGWRRLGNDLEHVQTCNFRVRRQIRILGRRNMRSGVIF